MTIPPTQPPADPRSFAADFPKRSLARTQERRLRWPFALVGGVVVALVGGGLVAAALSAPARQNTTSASAPVATPTTVTSAAPATTSTALAPDLDIAWYTTLGQIEIAAMAADAASMSNDRGNPVALESDCARLATDTDAAVNGTPPPDFGSVLQWTQLEQDYNSSSGDCEIAFDTPGDSSLITEAWSELAAGNAATTTFTGGMKALISSR
jgi:hypothetical protein